ncbi:hypothetical protein JL720_4722 [Aureococcus anophagefferens]|nr:hypothetical protein JL720_4722 [Aureococcus anophagefferens]
MPWRPPYEDVNATFAPTYNVGLTGLLATVALVTFFELKRRTRSARRMIFCPRMVWEGEVEAVSKRHGGDYAAQPRRRVGEVRTFDWVRATLFERTDADVLKHAGLEMYVYLRFVRLCLRLCVFGSCVCAPVLCTAYSTAASHYGYGRFSWYRYTIANIAEHRPGQDKGDSTHHRSRLWMPAVFMALLTAHAVTACYNECAALVELRQDFFTTAPKNADPVAAEQSLRSCMLERLPPHLRTSAALKRHWDALLPGRVHSAVVAVDAPDLTRLEREREAVALHLERLLLKRSRTDREPLVGDSAYPLERLCPAWLRPRSACCAISPGADLDAASAKEQIIPLLRGRLAGQNAAFADERARASASLENAVSSVLFGRSVDDAASDARRLREAVENDDVDDAAAPPSRASESLLREGSRLREAAGRAARRLTSSERHSSTGFVTFTDFTAAALARHMQLAPRPHGAVAHPLPPDRRDVIWENVAESLEAGETRRLFADGFVYMIALYWSFYISICYAISSYRTLVKLGFAPRSEHMPPIQRAVVGYVTTLGPVGLVSIALAVMPISLENVAKKYERRKLKSSAQLSVLHRNFLLQMINLWFTVIAGSIFDAAKEIMEEPETFLRLLGGSMPQVSVYFVELILIKTLVGLPFELSRVAPWLRLRGIRLAAGGALTPRDRKSALFLRPEFPYGNVYTTTLMVLVMAFLFAVIAPLIFPFAACFFAAAYLVYSHNAMHVYVPQYETGGIFFFPAMRRFLGALVATQLTLVAYLMLKRAWGAAGLTLLLPLATRYFQTYVFAGFEKSCNAASVESALGHDHELREPAGAAPAARRKRLSVLLSGGPASPAPDPRGRPGTLGDRIAATFDAFLYRQPLFDDLEAVPDEPEDVEVGVGAGLEVDATPSGCFSYWLGLLQNRMARLVLLLAPLACAYEVTVVNRSLAGGPLLSFAENTSWAPYILNPSWLPLADSPGGGLFFRVITAPNTSSYNAVGFIPASDGAGLAYPRATVDHLLDDAGSVNAGADPRAGWSDDESFFTYQLATDAFPGRHTFLSRTTTPDDAGSWRRVAGGPMFLGLKNADGSPFLEAAALATCDGAQPWTLGTDGRIAGADGYCLSLSGSPDASRPVGRVACGAASAWTFDAATKQLRVQGTNRCLDVDHGVGPKVGLYACHAPGDKDVGHQRWSFDGGALKALSAANGTNCVAVEETLANDCGTAVFFPDASSSTKAYAVATFGELRGANLSLVSSDDLASWTYERPLLETRPDSWDDATLSAGPAPQRLSDGSWLLLYNVDQLWPVDDPAPLPWFGRCALGWAILDGDDFAVLARAPEPLVYAALPWELAGFTDRVVYSDGVRPEGGDVFTVYAGAGDAVVEAFRIEVAV